MFFVHSFISEEFEVKSYSCPACFIERDRFEGYPTKQIRTQIDFIFKDECLRQH
jgi:hypothetical protein